MRWRAWGLAWLHSHSPAMNFVSDKLFCVADVCQPGCSSFERYIAETRDIQQLGSVRQGCLSFLQMLRQLLKRERVKDPFGRHSTLACHLNSPMG